MELEEQFDQKRKSIPTTQKDELVDNLNGSFECNICLDAANDSVVTLCGHLYCWSCIYKWLHIQSTSLPSDEYPQCPVCKAEISHTTLIPLYGRSQFTSTPEGSETESTSPDMVIPPRPTACETRALLTTASQPEHQQYRRNPYQSHPSHYASEEVVSSSSSSSNVFQPAVGMFEEMVYARVFGNSRRLYTYPNSYHYVGNSSTRFRRQEMQVDKSLTRILLFLLCCFFLCLFLF